MTEQRKPMKLDITKEQCLRLAELEGDSEVGAGLLARDPVVGPLDPIFLALTRNEISEREAVEQVLRHPEYGGNRDDAESLIKEWTGMYEPENDPCNWPENIR